MIALTCFLIVFVCALIIFILSLRFNISDILGGISFAFIWIGVVGLCIAFKTTCVSYDTQAGMNTFYNSTYQVYLDTLNEMKALTPKCTNDGTLYKPDNNNKNSAIIEKIAMVAAHIREYNENIEFYNNAPWFIKIWLYDYSMWKRLPLK